MEPWNESLVKLEFPTSKIWNHRSSDPLYLQLCSVHQPDKTTTTTITTTITTKLTPWRTSVLSREKKWRAGKVELLYLDQSDISIYIQPVGGPFR